MLSPLLNKVPSHLNNIYGHLETLKSLVPDELLGLKFCTADISSLYTNINVQQSLDDVREFAAENEDCLDLLGLKLVDVHEMLDLILSNAFFTYHGKLYLQLIGLFMGCKPSPIIAIIRVYMFEKRSIYTDINFLNKPYGRYIDDAYSLVSTLEEANSMFSLIADEDPDKLLQWEIDFPESDMEFTPFLGTTMRIQNNLLHHKFYRKHQKKDITLHCSSHHPLKMKVAVIKNFYRTAEKSSSPGFVEESFQVVDHLLRCNGYSNPRELTSFHLKGYQPPENTKSVKLKLPYISEYVSKEIFAFIKKRKLPISVIFTPGKKLKDLLCSSRPYDKPKCTTRNCKICACLVNDVNCTVKFPVYLITCLLCQETYVGESSRSLYDRLNEHLRFATSPDNRSYRDEAFAVHYRQYHHGQAPQLSFKLLKSESNTVSRKIIEAMYINQLKPEINDKEECISINRFLVKN